MITGKRIYMILVSCMIVLNIFSQYSLTGKIKNNESNEEIAFSSVVLQNINDSASKPIVFITDESGNFKIGDISEGDYLLTVSGIGFREKSITIDTDLLNDKNKDLTIDLEPKLYGIEEIQVNSLRQNISKKKSPLPVIIIREEVIRKESFATLSDLLNREAGLALQRDGIWTTSIRIRGLSEQRIVTLVNGNRIETATDLAAGLSLVDMNEIERVEVVKGALSSVYGTGAMGGIINIITGKGYYNDSFYTKFKLSTSFQSVNELYDNHLKIYLGSNNWYATIGGTVKNATDVKTPEGILRNSQFRDDNLSINAGFKPAKKHELSFDFQQYSAHHIGIPGGAALPPNATATYPVEKRILFSSQYEIKNISAGWNSISVKYYNQYILRDVLNIPGIPATITELNTDSILNVQVLKITPTGKHYTQGIQVQTDWDFAVKNNVIIGIDAWQRELKTEREKFIQQTITDSSGNVLMNTDIIRGEIPIPNATFRSIGFYTQEKYNTNDKLTVILGARIDLINVTNDRVVDPDYLIINENLNTSPPGQRITFSEENKNDISWSTTIGIQYGITKDLYSSFSFGRAFRSPSLEERFKYIDLGTMVRIGDPDLEPERGYLFDAGMKYLHPKLHIELNGFLNVMNNLIIEKSGEYIYNTVGDPELSDTIPVLVNSNVNEARLFGFDLAFKYNFIEHINIFGNMGYTIGKDVSNDDYLPLIPPVKGIIGIEYIKPKWFGTSFECVFAGKQNKAAENEIHTNGYAVLNYKLNTASLDMNYFNLQFVTGMGNILDKLYTSHLSSNRGDIKTEPGRNIYMKAIFTF